jgi:pyruvate kinase
MYVRLATDSVIKEYKRENVQNALDLVHFSFVIQAKEILNLRKLEGWWPAFNSSLIALIEKKYSSSWMTQMHSCSVQCVATIC